MLRKLSKAAKAAQSVHRLVAATTATVVVAEGFRQWVRRQRNKAEVQKPKR